MATVILDPLGRLIRFRRIPLEAPPADGALTVNWTALFGEAGLDEREFVPEKPERGSLVPHDTQFGWRRTAAGSQPLHVTAATLDGRVVEFDTSGGGASLPARDFMSSGRSPAAEVAIWAVFVSIFAGAGGTRSLQPATRSWRSKGSKAAGHRGRLPEPSFRDAPRSPCADCDHRARVAPLHDGLWHCSGEGSCG